MDILLEFLLELVLEVIGEIGLETGRVLDKEDTSRLPALAFFLVAGLVLGALSVWAFPRRLMRPGPFPGVSLFVVPALLGAAMQVVGAVRGRRRDVSHLATWYGVATAGFALAAGRLAILTLLGER